MTLRSEIFDAVTGDVTVGALIGVRCYPDRLPENVTLPAVSYIAHVSQNDADYRTHDTGTVPRTVARTQFNCYAATGDDADELASAVEDLWSGHKDGCTIGWAQIANRVDRYEPALNRHRVIVDVMVEYAR